MKPLFLSVAAIGFTVLHAPAQTPATRPQPILSPEISDGHVTFRLRAPKASEVTLRGQWSKAAVPMTRADDGTWSVTVDPAPKGVWE